MMEPGHLVFNTQSKYLFTQTHSAIHNHINGERIYNIAYI